MQLVDTFWLLRTSVNGGTDYVCFRDSSDAVEMIEAFHLPPQMPLLKRRRRLNPKEVQHCRQRLERTEGFRHGTPLF